MMDNIEEEEKDVKNRYLVQGPFIKEVVSRVGRFDDDGDSHFWQTNTTIDPLLCGQSRQSRQRLKFCQGGQIMDSICHYGAPFFNSDS